jgi:hypothetical protein
VDWISEVHCPVEGGRPLHAHPRIAEFLQLIQNKLLRGLAALYTKTLHNQASLRGVKINERKQQNIGKKNEKRKQRKVRRVLNKERKLGGNISFSVTGEIRENSISFPGIFEEKKPF